MKQNIYVYIIVNSINDKGYVGITAHPEIRWKQHLSEVRHDSNYLIHKAIRKHGAENFEMILIEKVEGRSVAESREKYWIRSLSTFGEHGYNLTPGGGGGGYTRIPEDVVLAIFYDRRKYDEIALAFGVSNNYVKSIKNGKQRGSVTSGLTDKPRSHSGNRKIDETTAAQIFTDPGFFNDIALKYGVSYGTVESIKSRRIWQYATEGLTKPNTQPTTQRGENHHLSSLTEEQVIEIFKAAADTNDTYISIADRYGVSPCCVSRIARGVVWRDSTKDFKPQKKHNRTKVTEDMSVVICSALSSKQETHKQIADRVGVSKSCVSAIAIRLKKQNG